MNRLLFVDSNTFFRKAVRDIFYFKFPSLIIEETESGKDGMENIFKPPSIQLVDNK